jgi:uncharacterized protein
MNYLSQYTVPFSGLKEGNDLFDFTADQRFFAGFEESEIAKGSVCIQVELEKRTTYLRLIFKIKGEVELICDRCLEPYNQSIEGEYPMLVKFSETETDDGDEIIYVHPNSHQVEVAKLIYEFIILSIPIRHVHPDGENGQSRCDPEMLRKIDEYKVSELQKGDLADPRWNELRKNISN